MLPFMKPKQVAGLIVKQRKPDGNSVEQPVENEENQDLEVCAEEIIRAIMAKDAKALATAIESAFQIMELRPHDEVSHEDSE